MFTHSPIQPQPTNILQPQMTGVPQSYDPTDRYSVFKNMNAPPQQQSSIFTPAGSMAYGQTGFNNQPNTRRW
ncbi:hypothetical protein BX666DRAFT_896458 [Dichotomocladium elegans]|nr:hypothetical protein BX666DRAFT_896458 [Dichotomocladium elegans]